MKTFIAVHQHFLRPLVRKYEVQTTETCVKTLCPAKLIQLIANTACYYDGPRKMTFTSRHVRLSHAISCIVGVLEELLISTMWPSHCRVP